MTGKSYIPEKPVVELGGYLVCASSSLPLHQVPATSLQKGFLYFFFQHQNQSISVDQNNDNLQKNNFKSYLPINFFDEDIVQLPFGMMNLD